MLTRLEQLKDWMDDCEAGVDDANGKLYQARRELMEELKSYIPEDYSNANLSLGDWDCPDSPIKVCVYDLSSDYGFDDCVFCHDPDERK